MNPPTRPTREELERMIDRGIARLEEALRRCRTEDVPYGPGISAALDFLELRTSEKWPFDQFRKALEDFSADDVMVKAEGRVVAGAQQLTQRDQEGYSTSGVMVGSAS
jgi:hypothetical protein